MPSVSPTPTLDPEVKFDSPQELLQHARWSPIEKRKALEAWLFTVRSRLDAVSEGMNNHPGGSYGKDVDLVRELERALAQLPPEDTSGGSERRP